MTLVKRAFDSCEPFLWAIPKEKSIDDETPHSVVCFNVQSAIYVPLLFGREAIGVMYVDNLYTRNAFSSTDFEIMRAIGNQVAVLIKDRFLPKERHKEEVFKLSLSRQFSPEMAEYVSGDGRRQRIGGERVDPVTILVSDVRSFTQMSSNMEPDDVVRMLNEMFDAFVPIIFEHNGIIDKFIGDSVLAVFGSPKPDDQQWRKALLASFEMQKAVQKIGEGRAVRRLPVFNVGISIHTGEVIHGLIGSAKRMEFTVIGDTVNQASRYCDGAGPGEIIISKSVYEHVYRMVDVVSKTIKTKHPDREPDLEAYVVTALK
jgi:class 3 adenylate cyclase